MEALTKIMGMGSKLCESPLEVQFMEQLEEFGIELDQQFYVGPFRIDFGVKEAKLALEVDSVQYHGNKEKVDHDNRRQKYIEELGWYMMRIPSWMIYKVKKLAAAEIALKYFEFQLTPQQKKNALGILAGYFAKTDLELTKRLAELGETL